MKKKVIISALALAIGAGLAGSVTSTVAWYQYSTRTTAALIGASGGTSGNLQLRIRKANQDADDDWGSFISFDDMATYLSGTTEKYGSNIVPITSGNLARNDAAPQYFYSNPIPGKGPYSSWQKAETENYIVIPLQLRYIDRSSGSAENVAKAVYLSDLELNKRQGETNDLSSALRFHVSAYPSNDLSAGAKTNRLISKNGEQINTHGNLDVDGDGFNDKGYGEEDKYGFKGTDLETIMYGDNNSVQIAYSSANTGNYSMVAKSEEDSLNLIDSSLTNSIGSKSIGSTVAFDDLNDEAYLNVDLTIWVEGWEPLDGNPIWNEKYIGAKFQVGFEFAIDPEVDA